MEIVLSRSRSKIYLNESINSENFVTIAKLNGNHSYFMKLTLYSCNDCSTTILEIYITLLKNEKKNFLLALHVEMIMQIFV